MPSTSNPSGNCYASAAGLLHCEEAIARILTAVAPIEDHETIPLHEAWGRVLARAVLAPRPVPFHTNSAVDGYAVRCEELPHQGEETELLVCGIAYAGHPHRDPLLPGHTVRIMTGAELPAGTGAVLMQEQVAREGTHIRIGDIHRPGENIRHAGEDIAQGAEALPAGSRLTAAAIGLAASLGLVELPVFRRLRVGLLSTGDEIIEAGRPFQPGRLYDSNRPGLRAYLGQMGVSVHDAGIVPDEPAALQGVLSELAAHVDLIVSTGGVSVGAADHTGSVLAALGQIAFWKVAIKPGRPLAFGTIDQVPFFGLPGNPVAVHVAFHAFVLPAVWKRMGIAPLPTRNELRARSLERIRKKPGRTEFQRGILRQAPDGKPVVATTGRQGSGILSSLVAANAYIVLEHERGTVEEGEWVTVRPFSGEPY